MASERAWVAQLSCGHVIGSKPPPMVDHEAPMDSVAADRQQAAMWGVAPQAREAKPPEPAFVPPPAPEALIYCHECTEGRWVVGLVENRDEPTPQLDKRRDETR